MPNLICALKNGILQIRVVSKDMIHGAFLSRDFPLFWILDELKDVFSWSDSRKNNSY